MAHFTTAQQQEISEFFQHLADYYKENENLSALADILALTGPGMPAILNAVQLGRLVRATFDDYEDVFSIMEDYSDTMSNIVDAYWREQLA